MLSAFLLQASTNLTAARGAAGVGGPVSGYWPVMVFFAVAVVFPVLPVVLGRFVRPNLYQRAKARPYECGIDPTTEAHDRFTVRFYIVAMLFIMFDIEIIFPLFSILMHSTRPISPVRATCVPPQACKSTPSIDSSRTPPWPMAA